MILKTSPFSIQDKNTKDLDNLTKKNPDLDDLMTEQNFANKKVKTVHYRRDLDSLGQLKGLTNLFFYQKIKRYFSILNQVYRSLDEITRFLNNYGLAFAFQFCHPNNLPKYFI